MHSESRLRDQADLKVGLYATSVLDARRPRQQSSAQRLGRLRSGEIPGIRGDEHGRPYATMVLVAMSFGLWLSLAFYVRSDFAITERNAQDVAWLCRYLGRITDGQLRTALAASGATADETASFAASLRDRIVQLQRASAGGQV